MLSEGLGGRVGNEKVEGSKGRRGEGIELPKAGGEGRMEKVELPMAGGEGRMKKGRGVKRDGRARKPSFLI